MDFGATAAFWGVSMLFVITPGADWAYAIASGVRHRNGVPPAVAGMLAGHLMATFAVAAGAAALLTASPFALTILIGAGSAYLIWLGVSALRHPRMPELEFRSASPGHGRLFARGIGISLLNPKVFLLFLALLPGFTSGSGAWPVGAQMVGLGVVHVANCAAVYFAVGSGAATILARRPRAAKSIGVLSGIVMIGLGLGLAAEQFVTVMR